MISVGNPSGVAPRKNLLAGAASPTQMVEQYKGRELGGLMNGVRGATARPLGTPDVEQSKEAPRLGMDPRNFESVDRMVQQGNESANARLQIRQQQAGVAKRAAAELQSAGGRGGNPYAYTGAGGRRKNIPGGVYVKQQVANGQGGGLGGRYGIQPQASNAFTQLESVFSKVFGTGIPVNDGFRSYEKQVAAYNAYKSGRGNLAAVPGTSNHGTGIALDLGGPFQNAGSPQHRWLQVNGPKFGWHWVGRNFSQVEPWHWEYRG